MSKQTLAVLCMLGAVTIYGSNFAISRYATLNGLTPWDLVALRFGVAGLVLLPVFLSRGGFATCAGVGWRVGLLLFVTSGFPMSSLMLSGLAFAPASHGASLGPGTVTVIGAIGSFLLFGVRLLPSQIAGLCVVLLGLSLIGWTGATSTDPNVWKGDLLFFATGLVWGGYPLLLQYFKLDALTSTAVVAVLSLSFLPIYVLALEPRIFDVHWSVVAFHAFNQGILNTVVGLWLWAQAVSMIGAGPSGRFPPLIPVIGTLSAIPLLGEWPNAWQITGVGLIVIGLLVVAGRRAKG